MSKKTKMLPNDAALKRKKSFKSWCRSTRNEYGYLALAMLIPAVLIYLIYFARGIHPFGDGTVLVLDLNAQYTYFFSALRNIVYDGGSMLYSWSRGLGGEFLGMYAYYLASPLSYLILLFPADKTQEFLLVLFMIKAAICGGTMGFYLHKHSAKKNKLTVIAFAIMYAMSAYCIVHMNNTMWLDAVMWLPLVAYGLEQLIKFGKYRMFTIFLALTLASNFYIGYMVCIFVLLYFFFYHLAYKDNGVNNPCSEKSHMGRSLIRVGFFSLIAIGIAAVIIFGAYYSLQLGKNEFSDPSWNIELRFDIFDLFFKMLPSSYDTVRIDGLPFIYCGLITVILAPLFFCSKRFTVREKVASGVFLAIFAFSFMISVVDLVWHGFQKPQWLNNRYSFMFIFFILFLAFRAFEYIEEISAKSIACVSAFIAFFVAIVQNFETEYVKKLEALSYGPDDGKFQVHEFATVTLTIVCLIAYISIIAVMKVAKNKDVVAVVLVSFIAVEVFLSGLCNINDLDEDVGFTKYYKYSEFNTLMTPVVDTLQKYDDSFYRSEITNKRKDNDNMALDIKGLTGTTSTLNKETIAFLHNMGYYAASHRSRFDGSNLVSNTLLGVKYIITPRNYDAIYGNPVLTVEDYAKNENMTLDEYMEMIESEEYDHLYELNIYENKYALSLAFASGDGVLYSDVLNFKEQNQWVGEDDERYNPEGYTTPFKRLNAFITEILSEDETVTVFKAGEQIGEPTVSQGVDAKISSEHNKYVGKGGKVVYNYTVPEGVPLYLYFPAFYTRNIKLEVYKGSYTCEELDKLSSDEKKNAQLSLLDDTTSLSNCSERIVELCYTDTTEYTVCVTINANEFYTKQEDSFVYYVDTELLSSVTDTIKEEQLNITKYTDDDIRGTLTTKSDNRTVLTTIPYDEGWKVYVDGKKVEIEKAVDALVAFEIEDAGEHEIRLVYRPTPVIIGLVITVASLAGFVLIIIFEDKLKKLWLVKEIFVVEQPVNNENLPTKKK